MAAHRKYNWEEWLLGKESIVVLLGGLDYSCSQSTMVQMIRNEASERGVRVRIIDRRDSILIQRLKLRNEILHTDQTTVVGQHPDALAFDGGHKEETESSN